MPDDGVTEPPATAGSAIGQQEPSRLSDAWPKSSFPEGWQINHMQ